MDNAMLKMLPAPLQQLYKSASKELSTINGDIEKKKVTRASLTNDVNILSDKKANLDKFLADKEAELMRKVDDKYAEAERSAEENATVLSENRSLNKELKGKIANAEETQKRADAKYNKALASEDKNKSLREKLEGIANYISTELKGL